MAGTNPRAVRIAGLIQRVIANSLEKDIHDPRLRNVTITEVRVTNDMQQARVFWTIYAPEGKEDGQKKRAAQALRQATGHLRTRVGRTAGLRLTPQLIFVFDKLQGEAAEVDDVLVVARKRDEELAKLRENAQYAGEADPYKHKDEEIESSEDAEAWDDTQTSGMSVSFDDFDDEDLEEDDDDDFEMNIIIDDDVLADDFADDADESEDAEEAEGSDASHTEQRDH
ncbi:30S ribosome-binding factor RbfA [Alloscardovia criceti]|uniref:30S ribosome-binding factor RbfA n=1 Tax=Alloscardovia criceti TaxID=356828 RepID=UPI00036E2E72|nr:30S ribosome-binding factor RbfA [Alloscardovia criceti]